MKTLQDYILDAQADVLQPNYVENGIPCHNRATANFYKNNPTK